MSALKPLRPHQQCAMDLLKASLATRHRRPMVQAPTGSGKTVIAAHIVDGALAKRNRVTFVVPALSLIEQTFERFVDNGIDPVDMGVMQGDHPWRRPHAPVQIATAQTLARRKRPDADLVIVDEAHIRHTAIERWMADEPEKIFIGLSATPWSKGLGKLYDDLLKPTSVAELIDARYLSPFRVYAPTHPDLSKVRTKAGDYREDDLGRVMGEPELIADVVSTWLVRGRGLPTLCFAVNRAHAKALHDRFAEAGVAVAYIDANTPREERDQIGRRLEAGEVEVVCNIGCLTTGVDWDVRCLILARPTKSESLFVQIIGRALRLADGKDFALILDHTDTHLRLGMVTDIEREELSGGTAGKSEPKKRVSSLPLPRECTSCTALMPASAAECGACGAIPPKPQFDEADGDLEELTAGSAKRGPGVRATLALMGPKVICGQLRTVQLERARSDGWVAHTYREIFERWPQKPYPEPIPPDPLLRSYVRHLDVRYARSRQATEVVA